MPVAQLEGLDLEVLTQRKSEKWHTYPPDVLPAWVAEMDFPVAEPIHRVLQTAVDQWDFGYPIAAKDTGGGRGRRPLPFRRPCLPGGDSP